MASKETAKVTDKVEKVDQGDRTSQEAADDAVSGGKNANKNHSIRIETDKDKNQESLSDMQLKALNPGSENYTDLQANRFQLTGLEEPALPETKMTTAEVKAIGGADAEMMLEAAEQITDEKKRLTARDAIKTAYGEVKEIGDNKIPPVEAQNGDSTILKGSVVEQNPWHALRNLPPETINEIARAFETGSDIGQQSVHETSDDILQKTIEAYKWPVDLAKAAYEGVSSISRFSYNLIFNPEQAQKDVDIASKHIGEALLAGYDLFTASTKYGTEVVEGGDYTKPLNDFGNAVNKWFENLTPGDQAGILANVSSGFGLSALGKELKVLSKPAKFTEFLQESAKAIPKNPEAQAKASETIKKLFENITGKTGLQTLPAGEAGMLGGQNYSDLADKLKDAGSGLKSKLDDFINKMKRHNSGDDSRIRHTNPIDSSASTTEKIAQLQKLSKENEPLVRDFIESIDSKYGTQSTTSMKAAEDIAEKASRPAIRADRPWFDVEHVRDSLRFKSVVDNLQDLPKLIEELKESGFEIIKCDAEKLLKPKGRGWRMAAFDLKAPNGQIIEYQILPPEMEKAGAMEHQVYKQWRGKDVTKMTKSEAIESRHSRLRALELYTQAWNSYLSRTGQTDQSIKDIINSLNI